MPKILDKITTAKAYRHAGGCGGVEELTEYTTILFMSGISLRTELGDKYSVTGHIRGMCGCTCSVTCYCPLATV